MLSQHLWPPHATPFSITSFQTQTLLQFIHDTGEQHLQEDEDSAQQDLVERHQLEEVDEDPVDQIGSMNCKSIVHVLV